MKLHITVQSSSMERIEQFESTNVNRSTLFSVFRSVTFYFMINSTFRKVTMRIGKVVHKISQKCDEHIYEESLAIPNYQSGPFYSI